MPVITGSALLQQVRDYADQPTEGDGTRTFVTDAMIYSWLSKGYRAALRTLARGGYPLSATVEAHVNPGATVTLSGRPIAVTNVSALRNTTLTHLPRLVHGDELNVTGTRSLCWKPNVTAAGVFTLTMFPGESAGTIKVWYVPDPADLAAASSVFLPSAWEDVVPLAAAMRCCARAGETNPWFKDLYNEALGEAEAEAQAFGESVMRNTDDVYPPGYDQGRSVDGTADSYDYSVFLV